ncbi:YSIRK-type signal peptide-containing protein [Streptococcus mitis]
MKKTKQQLEKITKYSIRKLTVGVGPVAIDRGLPFWC